MVKITESNVTLMVKDLDKSIQFYEKLGLSLKERWGEHYAMLSAADIVIGLHPTSESVPPSAQVSVGFMIDDISEGKAILDENRITYSENDGKSGIIVHFQDPDGTALYYMQPKYR